MQVELKAWLHFFLIWLKCSHFKKIKVILKNEKYNAGCTSNVYLNFILKCLIAMQENIANPCIIICLFNKLFSVLHRKEAYHVPCILTNNKNLKIMLVYLLTF